MGGVIGIEQQGPIARIQHRQRQVGSALLGSHQQQHLRFRIHRHPKTLLGPVGHGQAEGEGGPMEAVGRACRLCQLGSHRLDRRGGGLQVGGAEREVQQGGEVLARSPRRIGGLALVVAGKDAAAQP